MEVTTMTETTGPRIYVASLSDYNAGRLHGVWIDATQGADEIQEQVNAMLAKSPEPVAEEWAIHDYEGFQGVKLSEYESFEQVAAWAENIEEHGEAFAAWVANDPGYNTEPEKFQDEYAGTFDTEEAYAEEFVSECGWAGVCPVPDALLPYLDMEQIARDLFINDVYSVDGTSGVHVFRRM